VTLAPATTHSRSFWETAFPTDEEIVRKIVAGELPLFEVLMRRHNQRIYRAIRAILRDEAEVEDVMQQTYVSAYSNLVQFVGTARFSTWLTKIAINEALARFRRAAHFRGGLEVARSESVWGRASSRASSNQRSMRSQSHPVRW
jgi:RNA polymerase sigma factor (sigma-70 family)